MSVVEHSHRSTSRTRRVALAGVLGLVAVLASQTTGGAPAGGSPAAAERQAGEDRGRELYQRSCASCHGPQGEGTERGPSLEGVGEASVDFQLDTGRMPLSTGERYRPEHQEPEFGESDIRALVDYVGGFGGDGPPVPVVRPGDVRQGRRLFLDNCAACHSATGRGATLPGSLAPSLFEASPTQVGEAIRVGPGPMPAYPETVLDDKQVNALAGYVDTLQGEHGDLDRGGFDLGRVGPITEGLVGWAVGLLALLFVVRWLGSRAR